MGRDVHSLGPGSPVAFGKKGEKNGIICVLFREKILSDMCHSPSIVIRSWFGSFAIAIQLSLLKPPRCRLLVRGGSALLTPVFRGKLGVQVEVGSKGLQWNWFLLGTFCE